MDEENNEQDTDRDISVRESEPSVGGHGDEGDDSSDSDDDWSLNGELNQEFSDSETDGDFDGPDPREIGHGDGPRPVIRESNETRQNNSVRYRDYLNWALLPVLTVVAAIIIGYLVKNVWI